MTTMNRSLSTRQRIIHLLTDPSTAFSRDPTSPPPTTRFSEEKLASSKLTRSLFGTQHDIPTSRAISRSPPIPEEQDENTPERQSIELFEPDLLSLQVQETLPDGYCLRPLKRGDYWTGYLDVLRSAGNRVGRVMQKSWYDQFDYMKACPKTYFIVIISDHRDVVKAVGTLFIERKFINGMARIGHIKDVAVARDQKGKKLSIRIVEALTALATTLGCSRVCNIPVKPALGAMMYANSVLRLRRPLMRPMKPSTPNADLTMMVAGW